MPGVARMELSLPGYWTPEEMYMTVELTPWPLVWKEGVSFQGNEKSSWEVEKSNARRHPAFES